MNDNIVRTLSESVQNTCRIDPELFEKYGVKNGPDQEVVNIAYSLGCYCMEHDAPPQESMFYMQIVYGLTRDEKVKDKIDMLNAQIAAKNLAQESKNK